MSASIVEGQVLAGKYRVERVLGRGGMGMVIAAMHLQLQQRVAMKFLLPGANQEMIQRFLREARASVRLKSEHVAKVTDVATLEDGTPYMVMEYLEGVDLSQRLRQTGPLPIDEAVAYVLQACEAIAEAHVAGIVHRDLKPANLFLTTAADGSQMVKVLDFGIVKALVDASAEGSDEQPAVALTRTTAIVGSPLYMSPEQLKSARSVDARADIWSMGVVFFQLLTGHLPFEASEFGELFSMVITQAPASPRLYRPDLPEALEAAVLACLRRAREERFQNVGELAQAIAPFTSPEAQVSLPKILRTLGLSPTSMPASRLSMPLGSRSSFPASSASAVAPAPASDVAPLRPSLPPSALARTAQAASGPESRMSSTPPPPTNAGMTAVETSAQPPAPRRTAGTLVAIAGAGFTVSAGVVLAWHLWARGAEKPSASPQDDTTQVNMVETAVKTAPIASTEPVSQRVEIAPAPSDATAEPSAPAPPSPPPAPPKQKRTGIPPTSLPAPPKPEVATPAPKNPLEILINKTK